MRRRALAVISLSLVVIAAASIYQLRTVIGRPAVTRSAPGQAPYPVGRVWDCPAGWPIKAYRPAGVYYPTYHPAAPAYDVRPERCFQTSGEADKAGFHLAPPPAGGTILDGIYLMPTGRRLHDECLGAASLLRYTVPCPTVLPAPGSDDLCPITRCVNGTTFSLSVTFAANGAGGAREPVRYAQFFLTAAPADSEVGGVLSSCEHSSITQSVLGHQAAWGACFRGGEQISSLGWNAYDSLYEIQTREQTPTARAVIEYFASKLTEVAAPGR